VGVVLLTRESRPQSENSVVSVKYTRNITDAKINPLKAEILCLTSYTAITLQALTGPEGSRRLRLRYFKTIGI
jgi:hypothetical protein